MITLRHGHLAADRAGVLGRFGGCHHFPPARGARGKWRQSAHACQPGSPHAWEPGAPPACAEHQRMHSAHRVLGLKRLRPHERGADTRAPGRRRTGTRATSADRRRGCSLQTEGLVQFFEIRNRCHKKKCTHGGCQNHENTPFGSEENGARETGVHFRASHKAWRTAGPRPTEFLLRSREGLGGGPRAPERHLTSRPIAAALRTHARRPRAGGKVAVFARAARAGRCSEAQGGRTKAQVFYAHALPLGLARRKCPNSHGTTAASAHALALGLAQRTLADHAEHRNRAARR